MPRMPKRVKFRKQMRGNLRARANRGNYIAFGEYGLQSLEPKWLTARQIEAGRIAAQHFLRRQGKIVIRVFPDKPISKKPLETRMGKGKASEALHEVCKSNMKRRWWVHAAMRTCSHADFYQ